MNLGLSRRGENYRIKKREGKEREGCDITVEIRVKKAGPSGLPENILGKIGRL